MTPIELKYIIVKDINLNEYATLFPKDLCHKDVARIHRADCGPRVVSAGFCFVNGDVIAYGKSASLNILSRPEDANIIARCFK